MWDENFDERKHWDDYVSVNQAFAQAVADNYEPGDLGKHTSTHKHTHTHTN
jgi:trehalose-6-phosphate synthase